MAEYYHLRLDAPTPEFVLDTVGKKVSNYYGVEEISENGKIHYHMIVKLKEDEVQPLRCYLGITYKKYLKAHEYWKKTYKDSKKIQVYSLAKVRKYQKLWEYIHKDKPDVLFGNDKWNQEDYENQIKLEKDKSKKVLEKEMGEIDEFWEKYKDGYQMEYGVSIGGYQICNYLDAAQAFHTKFGDIKGFRVKFLKSAYKHNIIDFNTYLNKMYRL